MKRIIILALTVLAFSLMLISCGGTKGLEYEKLEDGTYGVKCGEAINEGEIVIPKRHSGKKVTAILKSGFSDCKNLTVVKIPKTITKIETGAFLNCKKLTDAYYGGSIADWCNIDFEHSTSNPMNIAKNFYIDNKAVTEITIKKIDTIKQYAFFGFANLTKVTIGNDVNVIGESAFAGCKGLKEISLPNELSTLSKFVFSGCTGFKSVTVPNSVTTVHPLAFYGCLELRDITFENTENWFTTKDENATNGPKHEVTNTKNNAKVLTDVSSYFWKRKTQ